MADRTDPDFPQIVRRQGGQHVAIDIVLLERLRIAGKVQCLEPSPHIACHLFTPGNVGWLKV